MPKKPKTVRIIFITSCGSCPYKEFELVKNKHRYYCGKDGFAIESLRKVSEKCTIGQIEIEEE